MTLVYPTVCFNKFESFTLGIPQCSMADFFLCIFIRSLDQSVTPVSAAIVMGLIAHVCIFFSFREKLESSVEQWEAYDSHHESLSQWLKDTEASLRGEATLKPDLASKKNQLDFFQVRATLSTCCVFVGLASRIRELSLTFWMFKLVQ